MREKRNTRDPRASTPSRNVSIPGRGHRRLADGAPALDSRAAPGLIGDMCGRFTLTHSPRYLQEVFSLESVEPFPPRYNIAPMRPILVVRGAPGERPVAANASGRTAGLVRWGLIPAWVKDPRSFPLLINARCETAAEKNAFRGAMRYRRCLVPASGFYEWRREGERKKQAFFLRQRGRRPVAFAGLTETWLGADGSEIDTGAILTTAANNTLAPIHDRMPVVIAEPDFERWLDCRSYAPANVADLLRPADDALFEAVPVSDKVNKVANIGPELQEPVPVAGATPRLTSTPADQAGFDF